MRYVHADVDPKPREDAIFPGLADTVRVKVSAPTAILEYDSRDNVFTPTRGIYAETSYLTSRESIGASDDFDRFQQLLTGWLPLQPSLTFGASGNYAWSSSGTPFFLRPYNVLRGVPAVRYQGDQPCRPKRRCAGSSTADGVSSPSAAPAPPAPAGGTTC